MVTRLIRLTIETGTCTGNLLFALVSISSPDILVSTGGYRQSLYLFRLAAYQLLYYHRPRHCKAILQHSPRPL